MKSAQLQRDAKIFNKFTQIEIILRKFLDEITLITYLINRVSLYVNSEIKLTILA